jgi:hypothetical protein
LPTALKEGFGTQYAIYIAQHANITKALEGCFSVSVRLDLMKVNGK